VEEQQHDDDGDDDDEDGAVAVAYQPPVFVQGRLIAFQSKTNDKGDLYTVEWDEDGDATEEWEESRVAQAHQLFQLVGTNIAKKFDQEVFGGKVVEVTAKEKEDSDESTSMIYRILYEDGDFEDFDEADLKRGKALYAKSQSKKKKSPARPLVAKAAAVPKKRPSAVSKSSTKKEGPKEADDHADGRRKRTRINYTEDKSDDDDEDMGMESDDDDKKPTAVVATGKNKSNKQKSSAKSSANSTLADTTSDDNDEFEAVDEDDDLLDADDDDMSVDESTTTRKKKAPAKKTTRSTSSKKTPAAAGKRGKRASSKDGDDDDVWAEYHTKLETDLKKFKPQNNPQKLRQEGDYVDSVGVDPTHGIVERIIADQVRKVGGLLQRVKTSNTDDDNTSSSIGGLEFPIQLQTACSGTDAPSIALGIIQESFNKMCPENSFEYEHRMSCEIEPFKQGYIARNFPGISLFPDITKLSATDSKGSPEKVVDVYGRLQDIPSGNLFIAGTSCKDFSMLKGGRKDIEDKGQSGETFLAAVEFLDLHQPPFAIFENVVGAPWEKMQEYIRGRIQLKNRNNNTAITVKNKQKTPTDSKLEMVQH
jgi:hypothetical protein